MATFSVFCRLDSGRAYWQANDTPANQHQGVAVSSFPTKAQAQTDAAARQKIGVGAVTFSVVQTA